jgi:hypothetical protein
LTKYLIIRGKTLYRKPDPGIKKAPDPGSGFGTLSPSSTDLLMFFGSLESPEWIGGVPVPVEELDGLARVVQHVFRGQALRLRDIPATGQYLEILLYTHRLFFSNQAAA